MLKYTLGSIVVLLSPLSAFALSRLLRLSRENIDLTFNDLHAILDISKDPTRPLRLHHPSFRDFLLNEGRCGEFLVDEKEIHKILATSCMQLLSQTLKKDICEMHAPDSQASQVGSNRLQNCLPPEVQHACLYWAQHLQKSGYRAYDGEEVHRFVQAHPLHWLEALGWMGKTSEGIQAILSLEAFIPVNENPNLHALIFDAKRFALSNRYIIEKAPLQLYCSALVFAPNNSIVRANFEKHLPAWIEIIPRIEVNWSVLLQTLECDSSGVISVAFSPDGKLVASCSFGEIVRLWDTATGALVQTLKGDSGHSIVFSPDSKLVVLFSKKAAYLWDTATGALFRTLKGHLDVIKSVAFSPNGKLVASCSYDKTVRLWDVATGAVFQTLKGHLDDLTSVTFSPNGKLVASCSDDKTVRIWDAATGELFQTLQGHSDSVRSLAFSPEGKLVASCSYDKTVRLWDITQISHQTHNSHSDSVRSVAFSSDNKLVMSISRNSRTRLWDAIMGTALPLSDISHWFSSDTFSLNNKVSYTIVDSNDWVAEGQKRILWIPPDFRPTCKEAWEANWKGIIAIGSFSGKVSILGFKEGSKVI